MSTTETKIDAILDAIRQDIAEREIVAEQAMHTLEKMKPSAEEYKDANLQFGANTYVFDVSFGTSFGHAFGSIPILGSNISVDVELRTLS